MHRHSLAATGIPVFIGSECATQSILDLLDRDSHRLCWALLTDPVRKIPVYAMTVTPGQVTHSCSLVALRALLFVDMFCKNCHVHADDTFVAFVVYLSQHAVFVSGAVRAP